MENLIVINNPDKWILKLPNTRVVSPRHYIMDSEFAQAGKYKVYNLCNAFNYQNMGYYVSLLAKARMHHPEPSVRTIMDFSSRKLMMELAWEAEEIANKLLLNYSKNKFELDVYFGKCIRHEYNRLGRALFARFQAPMFSAEFKRKKSGWSLKKIEPFSASDIDQDNSDFIAKAAAAYLSRPHRTFDIQETSRYSLAILADDEKFPSSNKKALARFVKAAQTVGFYCEIIGKNDFDRIGEFDALFIRSTTNVNNYTYRFSRSAYADGIVVVDDPSSIVRCANKVFQTEQATIKKIPIPNTMIVHKDNIGEIEKKIGFPLVVKQPDSQFSQGVFKAENQEELEEIVHKLMKGSALLIAQEFVPTKFDWRIGIFNRKPIFVCKYFMAESHWQIVNSHAKNKDDVEGRFETLPVDQAPAKIVNVALKAANLIGDGLYGVDVKETDDGRVLLIEVNDNPNIDAGVEDKVLGSKLYLEIMEGFWDRVNKIKKLQPIGNL